MALYAFDGSWKDGDVDPAAERTNVYRFKKLYEAQSSGNTAYWHGVGRRLGSIGKWLGGGIGAGIDRRVYEALFKASDFHSRGDETIDIIGFSRGGATAVAFAWALHRWGVRAPRRRSERRANRILRGMVHWAEEGGPLTYRKGELLRENPPIRFLGLFDAVFSTPMLIEIIPWLDAWENRKWRHRNRQQKSRLEHLPENIATSCHALAIHERKPFFRAFRFSQAYEVWFPGVHGDVGGGSDHPENRIADVTLAWMIAKAIEAGVPVDLDKGLSGARPELDATFMNDREPLSRRIEPGDRMHESAFSLPLDIPFNRMRAEPG